MVEWITRYTETDGTTRTGLYANDGSFFVVNSEEATGFVGLYHPCGAYWVTFTTEPSHKTYAPNGSMLVYREEEVIDD